MTQEETQEELKRLNISSIETYNKLIRLGWIQPSGQQAPLPKTAYFPEAHSYTKAPRFDKDTMANNRAFKRT